MTVEAQTTDLVSSFYFFCSLQSRMLRLAYWSMHNPSSPIHRCGCRLYSFWRDVLFIVQQPQGFMQRQWRWQAFLWHQGPLLYLCRLLNFEVDDDALTSSKLMSILPKPLWNFLWSYILKSIVWSVTYPNALQVWALAWSSCQASSSCSFDGKRRARQTRQNYELLNHLVPILDLFSWSLFWHYENCTSIPTPENIFVRSDHI